MRRALEMRAIRVLENERVQLSYGQQTFWLAGLADFWTRTSKPLETIAGIPQQDPIIVLMHNPDAFPGIPPRVTLTLAGHTHGGQVRLPFFGRPVVPSRLRQRYAYGMIEEQGKKMFVTAGVGTSILPRRFGVPPELVILTLMAQ